MIIPALLAKHPKHAACKFAVDQDSVTSNHALAESFSAMPGIYKVPNTFASAAIASFARVVAIKEISTPVYLSVIDQAQKRGVRAD
ncbi:MAG TPA: hypothetical protein VFM25_14290 [Verrucomicrobiae bacterium]|nr:hypothetical protein [Verrucomicrobiae bacterium]